MQQRVYHENQLFTRELLRKQDHFAVFSTTFLQSGKMLTDHAGNWYELPLNFTVALDCVPTLARKAEHNPDSVLYVAA